MITQSIKKMFFALFLIIPHVAQSGLGDDEQNDEAIRNCSREQLKYEDRENCLKELAQNNPFPFSFEMDNSELFKTQKGEKPVPKEYQYNRNSDFRRDKLGTFSDSLQFERNGWQICDRYNVSVNSNSYKSVLVSRKTDSNGLGSICLSLNPKNEFMIEINLVTSSPKVKKDLEEQKLGKEEIFRHGLVPRPVYEINPGAGLKEFLSVFVTHGHLDEDITEFLLNHSITQAYRSEKTTS